MSQVIVVVDFGLGNLGSISNMFRKIGATATISSSAEDIRHADKIVLPGVGAFDTAMACLDSLGLVSVLNKKVLQDKTPVLGICLGMQLFGKKSEEGRLPGLGWIDAESVKITLDNEETRLKLPHMGWNTVSVVKKRPLFEDFMGEARFYFVHSYHLLVDNPDYVVAKSCYGMELVAAVQKENIFGVQFHPEKSHRFGMRLLENFVRC